MKKARKKPAKQFQAQPQKNYKRPNLFGAHAVREAFLNPAREVQALYVTANSLTSFANYIEQALEKNLNRPQPIILEKKDLDKLLPKDTVHQNVAACVSDLPERSIQDFAIKATTQEKTTLLMLDQVTDPHNVGALIRSACALGIDGIIMQRRHAPELSGALAKIACGAVEHIPVAYETNLARSIEMLQEQGFFVYGLDERGENIQDTKFGSKSVLVLGAEGPGLRHLIKQKCDTLVKLPTHGAISSLNVSNAGAIAMYAVMQ